MKRSNDNRISETVYKPEHFPFNAQQNIHEYHYFGVG